jgi:tetrahydromethanopterin S-methyltransferase subunit G
MRTEEDLQKALVELDAIEKRVAKVSVEGSIQFNPGKKAGRSAESKLKVA